jgi:hypothetical protein
MLRALLVYSLERIASLQHFYELENENIRCKAAEGMKVNWFGYMADRYFAALSAGAEEQAEETKQLRSRLDSYIEVIKSDKKENSVVYKLKQADVLKAKGYEMDIKKAALKYRQYADMPVIHGSNTLIMLITRFEEFISHFLSELYIMFPKKYLDNQSITFSELSSLNVEDVKNAIVDRQIDATMRESYKEWFKIFESHKLSFQEYSEELKTLEEVYARRNVLVHNSGKVNGSYLAMVKNSDKKVGELLPVDEEYLKKAFDAVNVIIFAMIIEAVKLVSTDKNEYLQAIFDQVFDHLCEGRYYLCSKVYSALKSSKHLDAMYRTMSTVNYWIAKIEIVGLNSVRSEIEDFDVSALNPMFALAKYVLLCEYDAAESLLDRLYPRKEIDANSLETWPLFVKFRTTEQYMRFKSKHTEDFKVATFEINVDNARENQGVQSNNSTEMIVNEDCGQSEDVGKKVEVELDPAI